MLIAVALLRHLRMGFELEAVEVLAQDHVGDPGDGVGAIDRRRTVEQDFVLLHDRARDQGQIGGYRGALDTRRSGAPSVDQHQRARLSQPPQIERRVTRTAVEHQTGERDVDLRAGRERGLLQHGCRVDLSDFTRDLSADDLQRRDARKRIAPQARAGHDDLFEDGLRALDGCRHGRGVSGLSFILLPGRRRRAGSVSMTPRRSRPQGPISRGHEDHGRQAYPLILRAQPSFGQNTKDREHVRSAMLIPSLPRAGCSLTLRSSCPEVVLFPTTLSIGSENLGLRRFDREVDSCSTPRHGRRPTHPGPAPPASTLAQRHRLSEVAGGRRDARPCDAKRSPLGLSHRRVE